MGIRSRVLSLVVGAAATATLVAGQDIEGQYFPYEVGDRWVYDVDGTTSAGDTIDAQVNWTLAEIRTSPEADTLVIEAVRTDSDGRLRSQACTVARIRQGYDFEFLEGIVPAGLSQQEIIGYREICMAGGGFPFSGGSLTTSYYSYLHDLTPIDTSTITVGSETLDVAIATAAFTYERYLDTRNQRFHGTRVSAKLADGIGLIEAVIAENREFQQYDTLRTVLVGADVGGTVYGDIQAVALQDEPSAPSLGLRAGPNPTLRHLEVEVMCGGPCSPVYLRLVDIRGRTLLSQTTHPEVATIFDLTSFPAGVYVVQAETAEGAISRRITLVR